MVRQDEKYRVFVANRAQAELANGEGCASLRILGIGL